MTPADSDPSARQPDTTPEQPTLAAAAGTAADPDLRHRWWIEVGVVVCLAVLPDFWSALGTHLWSAAPAPGAGTSVSQGWSGTIPWFSALIGRSVGIVPVILYLIWRSGEGWGAFGFKRVRWFDPLAGGALFALAYVVGYFFWVLIWAAGLDGYFDSASQAQAQTAAGWSQAAADLRGIDWLVIVVGGLFNAIGEEVVLYGFLFPRIRQLLGPAAAIVAVPLLFTSYHIYYDPISLLWIFAFGFTHALMYAATRRIWPLIVSHAIGDLLWVVQM